MWCDLGNPSGGEPLGGAPRGFDPQRVLIGEGHVGNHRSQAHVVGAGGEGVIAGDSDWGIIVASSGTKEFLGESSWIVQGGHPDCSRGDHWGPQGLALGLKSRVEGLGILKGLKLCECCRSVRR